MIHFETIMTIKVGWLVTLILSAKITGYGATKSEIVLWKFLAAWKMGII